METANLIQIAKCCYNTQPNNSEAHKNTFKQSVENTLTMMTSRMFWKSSRNPSVYLMNTAKFPSSSWERKIDRQNEIDDIVHTVSSLQTQPQSQNNSEFYFRLQTWPDADCDSKPNLLHGSLSLSLSLSLF